MKLSLIKALYIDELKEIYSYGESENIFYIAIQWLERRNKTDVILGLETLLKETYIDVLVELKAGKPIQYITQETSFYSQLLYVNKNVLIPRPETEELVHWVIQNEQNKNVHILDIGTGSGCIALTLKIHLPKAKISACDISQEALSVAKYNAKKLEIDVNFFTCNILTDTLDKFDIIVSNPPYIAVKEKSSIHQNVLDFEPHEALFVADNDPLIFYKTIINKTIKNRSILYFETSEFYTHDLEKWLEKNKLKYEWRYDFQGKKRLLRVFD